MKNINSEAPITKLRNKQRSLNTELNNSKKELTSKFGTERKKRSLLKQIVSIEKELTEIDNLIKEEKRDLVKQYTLNSEQMFYTPPKKQPTITLDQTTSTNNQTQKVTDTDIIERDIEFGNKAAALPQSVPSVTFSVPEEHITIHTPISEQTTQNTMNISNPQTISNVNEKGTIPKNARQTTTFF